MHQRDPKHHLSLSAPKSVLIRLEKIYLLPFSISSDLTPTLPLTLDLVCSHGLQSENSQLYKTALKITWGRRIWRFSTDLLLDSAVIENCFLFVIFSLIWSCSDIACQVGREVVQWTKVQWPKFSFKFYSHFHWVLTEGFLFSFIEFLWSLESNFVCILSFVSGCLRPGTKAAKTKSIKNTYSFFLLLMQFILFSIQADEKNLDDYQDWCCYTFFCQQLNQNGWRLEIEKVNFLFGDG